MKYTDDEIEILEAIENNKVESKAFDNKIIKAEATKTVKFLKEKKQISINMKNSDLEFIKQRANDIGISYQNIIQALVHNYATGKLKLTI